MTGIFHRSKSKAKAKEGTHLLTLCIEGISSSFSVFGAVFSVVPITSDTELNISTIGRPKRAPPVLFRDKFLGTNSPTKAEALAKWRKCPLPAGCYVTTQSKVHAKIKNVTLNYEQHSCFCNVSTMYVIKTGLLSLKYWLIKGQK